MSERDQQCEEERIKSARIEQRMKEMERIHNEAISRSRPSSRVSGTSVGSAAAVENIKLREEVKDLKKRAESAELRAEMTMPIQKEGTPAQSKAPTGRTPPCLY